MLAEGKKASRNGLHHNFKPDQKGNRTKGVVGETKKRIEPWRPDSFAEETKAKGTTKKGSINSPVGGTGQKAAAKTTSG